MAENNEESAGTFNSLKGTIRNLDVADSYVGSNGSYVGGFVAYNSSGTIDSCSFEGLIDN